VVGVVPGYVDRAWYSAWWAGAVPLLCGGVVDCIVISFTLLLSFLLPLLLFSMLFIERILLLPYRRRSCVFLNIGLLSSRTQRLVLNRRDGLD